MIVELKNLSVTKIFREGGKVTGTKLISNRCCSRTTNLFVVAIHGGEYKEEKVIFSCRAGKVLPENPKETCHNLNDCDKFETWSSDQDCLSLREDYHSDPSFSGKYKVSMVERPGKLPVLHLNLTTESSVVDAMWIELSTGEVGHDSSNYKVEGEQPETLVKSTVYSGGGAHQCSVLIGVAPIGTIVRYFSDSYKSRHGSITKYYRVSPDNIKGLVELPVELADGLTLEDLSPPEE